MIDLPCIYRHKSSGYCYCNDAIDKLHIFEDNDIAQYLTIVKQQLNTNLDKAIENIGKLKRIREKFDDHDCKFIHSEYIKKRKTKHVK